jgi:hypothetical protein
MRQLTVEDDVPSGSDTIDSITSVVRQVVNIANIAIIGVIPLPPAISTILLWIAASR